MRSEKEVRKEFEELETELMNSAKEYFKSKKQKESFSKYKTFFKLWDRYGGGEPLTYFSSDDGFGEDIGEYFALNWVLEGELKKASTNDFNHPNVDSVYIESTKGKKDEPRYSVAELEKILESISTTCCGWGEYCKYDDEFEKSQTVHLVDLFKLLKDKKKVEEILK